VISLIPNLIQRLLLATHKSHITSTYKRLEVVDKGDANKSLKNLIYILVPIRYD